MAPCDYSIPVKIVTIKKNNDIPLKHVKEKREIRNKKTNYLKEKYPVKIEKRWIKFRVEAMYEFNNKESNGEECLEVLEGMIQELKEKWKNSLHKNLLLLDLLSMGRICVAKDFDFENYIQQYQHEQFYGQLQMALEEY